MIELGLSRITRLLQHQPTPSWRAIHVAGTNGKGSICAVASALLRAADLRCGRFTSPHLLDRWDCVALDSRPVSESLFRRVEARVREQDVREGIGASPFELLAATAFEIFEEQKVDVAVVEVGMGGRLDATNALRSPLVTVVAKVGLDHQAFLGDTLVEIAREKAEILKPGVPCVVDATNDPAVLDVVVDTAKAVGAGPIHRRDGSVEEAPEIWKVLPQHDFEPHQRANLSCAVRAVELALQQLRPEVDVRTLLPVLMKLEWPGRLQRVSIDCLTGRQAEVLLDGAHNPQAAKALALYVDRRLRQHGRPVTWLLAASSGGKDVKGMLNVLLKPGDAVVAVEFGPVDGMPWVSPTPSADLVQTARAVAADISVHDCGTEVLKGLTAASRVADGGPLVVTGSLYLISDVLRLLRDAMMA